MSLAHIQVQGVAPADCEGNYRNRALRLHYETPFTALFRDLRGITVYEASGLELSNGTYYTVFDRLCALPWVELGIPGVVT